MKTCANCHVRYSLSTAMNENNYCSLDCEQKDCAKCVIAKKDYRHTLNINCEIHGSLLPYQQ